MGGESAAEGRKAEAAEAAVAKLLQRGEPALAPRAAFEDELLERLVALRRHRGSAEP